MKEKNIYKEFTAKVLRARAITIPHELCSIHDIQESDFVKVKLITVTKHEG